MRILKLGLRPYIETEAAMRAFTHARTLQTEDELWLVEHPPVFTQGVAGRDVHVLAAGHIPVVRTERGGQVTYHGPGQVVAYPLLDLRRIGGVGSAGGAGGAGGAGKGIYVKEYVFRLEEAVLATLGSFGVIGHRVRSAPGIYVRLADPFGHAVLQPAAADPFVGLGKIAALGIKVSQHRTYHGVALNAAMDLEPFDRIDPCGYAGLRTVDLKTLGVDATWAEAASRLAAELRRRLA